jgi:FkbM family methyltransferase
MAKKIFLAFFPSVSVLALIFFSFKMKLWEPMPAQDEIFVYRNELQPKPIRLKTNRITGTKMKDSLLFLRSFLKEGDLVFDIGANIGLKTDLYLACGAKVVCFEPQPECVLQLKKKYQDNARVLIEEIGLGSKEGEQELFLCKEVNALSTFSLEQVDQSRFSEHGYRWEEKIAVPISTLDKMLEKYGSPHYCKIDVENYEFEVLKGLAKPIPILSIECNIEKWETSKQCIRRLIDLGYDRFNFAVGATDLLLFPRWVDGETFISNVEEIVKKKDFSEVWGLWGEIYAKCIPASF